MSENKYTHEELTEVINNGTELAKRSVAAMEDIAILTEKTDYLKSRLDAIQPKGGATADDESSLDNGKRDPQAFHQRGLGQPDGRGRGGN
jgi:hypothetical protein